MTPPRTIKQCKSCPWRVGCNPDEDIPNYDRELACGLTRTIQSGIESLASLNGGVLHMMACHYSKPGEEIPCAGWLHNQLGEGNNLALRVRMLKGDIPPPEVDGEQHARYEDTLCAPDE